MGRSITQQLTDAQEVFIDFHEKKVEEIFYESLPLATMLKNKGKKQPVKTWNLDIQTRFPRNPVVSAIAQDIARATLYPSDDYEKVTRTMRKIYSEIPFHEDELFFEGRPDSKTPIEVINKKVDSYQRGHLGQIFFEWIANQGGLGTLFKIPYDAVNLPNTYAAGIRVPVDPKYWAHIHAGQLVAIYQAGAVIGTATHVQITGKKMNDDLYPSYPYVVTLDYALTGGDAITSEAIVVAHGSYNTGCESLYDMVNHGAQYMGLNPATDLSKANWNPFKVDAGNQDIDLDDHVGAIMEEMALRNSDGDFLAVLNPVQYRKIRKYIENHQTTINNKPLERIGGWQPFELTIDGKGLKYVVDHNWVFPTMLPIIDLNHVFWQYAGDNLVFFDKVSTTPTGRTFIREHPLSLNRYEAILNSFNSGLLTDRRDLQAVITNLKTS